MDVTRYTVTFPTGHLTNQSTALDVTRYKSHFLPDTWKTNPMHWTWLGTQSHFYRKPDIPIQCNGRDSVYSHISTGHLISQSNAMDVTRYTHTFPTGQPTNQSNALDVTLYKSHFLPDTWYPNPMQWTWLGIQSHFLTDTWQTNPVHWTWLGSHNVSVMLLYITGRYVETPSFQVCRSDRFRADSVLCYAIQHACEDENWIYKRV